MKSTKKICNGGGGACAQDENALAKRVLQAPGDTRTSVCADSGRALRALNGNGAESGTHSVCKKPEMAEPGRLDACDLFSVACCTLNRHGLLLEANHAALVLLGSGDDAKIGHPFSSLILEDDEELYLRCLQQLVVLGTRQVCDVRLSRNDGASCWVQVEAYPAWDEEGIVVFRVVLSDISGRKRVEEELRRSRRRLAEALRTARIGAWEWNVITDELDWSDEMFRIVGLPAQSLPISRARFLKLVHPDDCRRVREQANRALNRLENYTLQYRIVTPNSELRVVREQGEVEPGNSAVPVRMFGTLLDVTEEVNALEDTLSRNQELIQADKLVSLGILAAGVAHEINNPNHAIMSSVNVLTDIWESARPILDRFHRDFGDFVLGGMEYSECRDKVPETIASALSNARRIALIVDELRDFARHSPREEMSAVDVSDVVKSAIVLTGSLVKRCTHHFSVAYGQDVPPVLGNFQRIEQVVINLIQNACQSLDSSERSVRVATRRDPVSGAALILVCDEGIGIPKENRNKLGKPFFTTKRSEKGMGLGLWTCFNIAREHGGMLTFSDRKGGGTQAVFALPAASSEGTNETDWFAL